MAGRGLITSERTLLGEILARRDPGLLDAVEQLTAGPLEGSARERMRRAIVDELCELPETAGRRALELEELLIRLGRVGARV
jgi:hypothetical protein